MFDFDGSSGSGGKVSLAGGGRNRTRGAAEESRADFVKRQHKEREARERKRIRERAATQVQALYRSYRCLRAAHAVQRQTFDKRSADIAKVGAVLPPDKKAKFIYLALMPMLRPFAFFFSAREDGKRFAVLKEFVLLSSSQPAASNVFHLAVGDDDAQRRGFLVLFSRLVAAALRLALPGDAAQLLLAMQAGFQQAAPSTPADQSSARSQRVKAAIGHVLRHTGVLAAMSREVLPKASANDALGFAQAVDLISLCCAGLEACSWADRQQPLVYLLSTPGLGTLLCNGPGPESRETVRRLLGLLPGPPEGGKLPEVLREAVGGSSRRTALLSNMVAILERYLLSADDLAGHLQVWLGWLCWTKEQAGGPEAGPNGPTSGLDRLFSQSVVRALVQAVDRQGSEVLLAACRLYFSPSGEGEAPAEVLQTLAFATPLSARLFPTLAGLMRGTPIETVYEALGPPTFATPEAMRLRIFCATYALQMQPMYDYEFFGPANPLGPEEIQVMTPFVNRLAYHFVTSLPNKATLDPPAKALRTSLTSLVCLLYNRHCRRAILAGENAWVIPESRLLIRRAPVVDLGGDDEEEGGAGGEGGRGAAGDADEDDAMEVEEESAPSAPAGARRGGGAHVRSASAGPANRGVPTAGPGTLAGAAGGAQSAPGAEQVLEALLEEIPHVLPFQDRVELLHNVIQNDQASRRDTRGPWAQAAMQRHQIRRNFLVEDGFAAFEGLTEEGSLRDVFRVEFIAPNGEPESGVDGGGLFKEFMVTLNRAMFDPEFGLFSATSDQTLYPSASAFRTHERAADLYAFLGKVVGKAIYEMFLLEAQFSRVFLNRLLGRTNEVDDVAALDRELHRNMLQIREASNVDELGLTFSVTVSELGHCEEIDLTPNGRNVLVTKDNLTRYLHLMANYKTNVQFQRQTAAFLRGLQCVIPLAWLKMFDPYELNVLVSGSTRGFDVQDLRRNTNYSGGYQDDSPVVEWLWQLLQHHMDPEDMGRFLMFATSCSRAPLLGFKTLYPAFCIHRVPDSERLPTASTCANLLKLPDYTSMEVLKTKLLQAIRAEAGFDLS